MYLEVTRIAITSSMSSNFSQIRPLTAELSALTRITTISWMSSNFDQIRPLIAELTALECLKNQYFFYIVASLFLVDLLHSCR